MEKNGTMLNIAVKGAGIQRIRTELYKSVYLSAYN